MAVVTGELPAAPIQRPRVLMIGTAFATAATLMYFAALLGMYLTRRSETMLAGDTWLPDGVTIPLTQPNVMAFTMISSAITMQWAVYAAARNDRVNLYLSLGITLIFGAAFVNMTSYLYTVMQFEVASNTQSVLVYAITGGHIVMVLAAMVFVGIMAFRALGGQETSRQHDGICAAAMFWHASVVVFCIIWYAVYQAK